MSYEAGSGDKLGRVSPSQKLQEAFVVVRSANGFEQIQMVIVCDEGIDMDMCDVLSESS